jgi:hypothetical protein
LRYRVNIKGDLGITIKEKNSPIQIAKKFLELFALKLCNPRKKGARGQQQRYYQAPEISPLRQEIFRVWLERDIAARAERLAAEAEAAAAAVSTPATALDIGDLNPDLACDTTEQATKCGIHTGNNIYISSGVDTSDVPTGESVATGVAAYPVDEVATEKSLSSLEILIETLAAVNTHQEFWRAVEGHEAEEIEDAIALSDTQPTRRRLQSWYEAPLPVATPATALNIGDFHPDLACDTTDQATNCGIHTGNNIYISSGVDTSDVAEDTKPAPKIIAVMPHRLRQVAAGVAAAATIAISGLPAAAAPVVSQTPVAPKASELVQPIEYKWQELPQPGTFVHWVDGGTEKLELKAIDPDGRCQVKSLLSGSFTNTRVEQLKPATFG